MRRGWRNDPAWIAHYQRRDEERAKREMKRAEVATQLSMNELARIYDARRRGISDLIDNMKCVP